MGDEKLLKDIGARINARRKELYMTQERLAESMEVSIQMISNLELGKKAIRPENLVKLCAALNVSADYILRGKSSDWECEHHFKNYEKLPRDKQELIDRIIDTWIS